MRSTLRTSSLAALASACAASLSCATLGESVTPGASPFVGVRKIALVRSRNDPEGARPKDVLDALAESLTARGYETRWVELGPRVGDDLRPVERLYTRMDGWIVSAPPRARFGRPAEAAGADAAAAVRALGVDAVVMFHRFDNRPLAGFPEPPPGGLIPRRPEAAVRRPGGALSLVDREGRATWFPWGGPGADLDPTEPANAAEAIDMLLRALAGEPDDG